MAYFVSSLLQHTVNLIRIIRKSPVCELDTD